MRQLYFLKELNLKNSDYSGRLVAQQRVNDLDYNLYYIEIQIKNDAGEIIKTQEGYCIEKEDPTIKIFPIYFINISTGNFVKIWYIENSELQVKESNICGHISDIGEAAKAGLLNDLIEDMFGGWSNFEYPSSFYDNLDKKELPDNFRSLEQIYKGFELLFPYTQYEYEDFKNKYKNICSALINKSDQGIENIPEIKNVSEEPELIYSPRQKEFIKIPTTFEIINSKIQGLKFKLREIVDDKNFSTSCYLLYLEDKVYLYDFGYADFYCWELDTVFEKKLIPEKTISLIEDVLLNIEKDFKMYLDNPNTYNHNIVVIQVLKVINFLTNQFKVKSFNTFITDFAKLHDKFVIGEKEWIKKKKN